MIRPDTLAEGLKATQPEMLFSPLALPDISVAVAKNGKEKQLEVNLKGVALGLIDARDLYQRGLLLKEGGLEAMDHYFHQVTPEGRALPIDRVLPQYARERSDS